jgi:hypothetical protein
MEALGLGPATAGAKPKPAAAATPAPGKVRLTPMPPLASVTLTAAGPDGGDLVIGPEGLEVDEETAQAARESAWVSGLRLREG